MSARVRTAPGGAEPSAFRATPPEAGGFGNCSSATPLEKRAPAPRADKEFKEYLPCENDNRGSWKAAPRRTGTVRRKIVGFQHGYLARPRYRFGVWPNSRSAL